MKLSRRDAIKAMGVAGVGIAAAGVAAPQAVAETTSDVLPVPRKFWWVKEVDEPTIEIDWDAMEPFGEWQSVRGSLATYRGDEEHAMYTQLSADNLLAWETEGKAGYTTKDIALNSALGKAVYKPDFMGLMSSSTPADRGVANHVGTPDENATMIRAAMRHMGASNVGFVLLEEETTKKLIYSEEPSPGKESIVFEDVEVGYRTDDKIVIPNKAKYAIVFTVQMSNETMKYGPTALGQATTQLAYSRLHTIINQTQEFIRGLGYNSYAATTTNGLGIYPGFAVMAGLGEMSRLNRLITPEHGPMVRCSMFLTDLPVTPSKPIDFGVMQFCKDCKTCAEFCPSGALSMADEPTWEVAGEWNKPGIKTYYEDSVQCRNYWSNCGTNCGICFSVCPYAADDEASLHKIVKATIATTDVFNSLLVSADQRAFPATPGEPMKDPEEWWANTNLAELGIDTRAGGKDI